MNRKHIPLIALLVLAAFLVAGCGVAREGVDVRVVEPDGFWQTAVVWPLARVLISLSDWLKDNQSEYPWGYAIILFTIGIRIVLLPLTYVQIKGMQSQKDVQPKLQELQKKYGKDRDRLMREQRRLYEEEGINPLSGCLPILLLVVQMPILFGLYSALVVLGPELDNASFFWIPDLGFPEFTGGLGWITTAFSQGDYVQLLAYMSLPAFLVITQFVMSKMTNPAMGGSTSSQAGTMKSMGTIMTVMFGFFSLQVPAGLSLYWVTGNIIQLVQQYVMAKMQAKPDAPAVNTGSGQTATAARPASASGNHSHREAYPPVAEGAASAPAGANGNTARKRRKKRRKKRG